MTTDWHETLRDARDLLSELVLADLLLSVDDGTPEPVSREHAARVLERLNLGLAQVEAGYDADHPLVRCSDCSEEFTACELGNHYCPSCGESAEGAELVEDPSTGPRGVLPDSPVPSTPAAGSGSAPGPAGPEVRPWRW